MKALFITTQTNDVNSLVNAWDCWNDDKSSRVTFNHKEPTNDGEILYESKKTSPEIIFYIGNFQKFGTPDPGTFRILRTLAPIIHLCCDAGDPPWHPLLTLYKEQECFDLQVTLDGCDNSPVEHVTITPVDPTLYAEPDPERDIFCGFSGNFGMSPRGPLVQGLGSQNFLKVRRRHQRAPYEEHVEFTRRCKMIFNVAYNGSGKELHVKGRVLEAALAGCAILETRGSPATKWLPEEHLYLYEGFKEAKNTIKTKSVEDITEKGNLLRDYVRDRYHPRNVYGSMLKEIGFVDSSL